MTETSPISTLSALDDPLDLRVSTVGAVQPHLEICVRDPATGRIVPRGRSGEFCTRGYSVMRGYWNDEAATSAAIDAAGWMHSGDLAVMEESGYVHIVGRLKDMIIRGGENISPREIEELLRRAPRRQRGSGHRRAQPQVRRRGHGLGPPAPGATPNEEELTSYCRSRLASFKVPRYWQVVETFPMTVTGKIQKYRLRQMAVELLGLQTVAAEKTA